MSDQNQDIMKELAEITKKLDEIVKRLDAMDNWLLILAKDASPKAMGELRKVA